MRLPSPSTAGSPRPVSNHAKVRSAVDDSQWAAIKAISGPAGDGPETLRKWVRQAKIDAGEAAGVSSGERRELRELRRKNSELEQRSKS
jgi:transposase-like protein